MKKNKIQVLVLVIYFTTIGLVLLSTTSCSNDCMYTIEDQQKLDGEVQLIRENLLDTLQKWHKQGLPRYQSLDRYSVRISSAVLVNSNRDRVFLWYYLLDTTKEAKLDYVQYIIGEKSHNNWVFEPNFKMTHGYPRSMQANGGPWTFEELRTETYRKVANGGAFEGMSCQVSDEYIDGWFKNYE